MNTNVINALIVLSGSVMAAEDVLRDYKKLTPAKKKYLYGLMKSIIKKYNNPFDEAQPLLVVDIGICSSENNVDPAVVLLALVSKEK